MGNSELLKTVEDHLQRGIVNVRGSRDFYRRGSQAQVVATTSLSALTTLLVGLNEIYHEALLAALALALAAMTMVATAWTSWFSFRRLWINNTVALTRLYALRDRIDYDKARDGEPEPDLVASYRNELDGAFADLNAAWVRTRDMG